MAKAQLLNNFYIHISCFLTTSVNWGHKNRGKNILESYKLEFQYLQTSRVIVYLLSRLNCCKQPGNINSRPRLRAGAHLTPAGVQVVAIWGEEQVGEASVVAGRQKGQQGAVLAGVKAGAAGVRAAGVNGHAGAEAEAGDDATLALLLHCSRGERES